jgi:ATP-dependent RNA helicase DeaD
MRDPETVVVNPERVTVPGIEQRYYIVHESDKTEALARLLEVEGATSALVFARTKVRTAELTDALVTRGIGAEALHGDMPQNARERVMAHFREGQIPVLVATDVAARGLDIDDISHVINYDVPHDPESYVHRIGRTGRAGKHGVALMLLTPREERRLQAIEIYTQEPVKRAMVPTDAQVQSRRDTLFLNRMLESLAQLQEPTSQLVDQLCGLGFSPEQIAAAALTLAQSGDQSQPVGHISPAADFARAQRRQRRRSGRQGTVQSLAADRRRSGTGRGDRREVGMVRLAMDVGRSQGIRPRDVVGAIASEADIPGKAIGAISIGDERTLVDVAEKHVQQVLGKMQRCRVRGNWVMLYPVD